MASGGNMPPDASLTKFYKCHPATKVGAVVCIVCGQFYHTTEIVNKYNAGVPVKLLNNSFIICQEHANFALTSNVTYGSLDETAGHFIAQLKQETREQIKQEILQEIVQEKNEENGMDITVFEDYSELEALKIENNLLKQLYEETKENNQLLKELLTKERQNNNNNKISIQQTKSYAEAISNQKPKNKKVPKLVVKKTNNIDNLDLEKVVLHYLSKDKTIQTKSVTKNKNKDTVIINCMNEESVNTIEKTLNKKLTANIKIEKEQIKKPIVKIVNIDKIFETDKDLEQDINVRNFNNIEDKCKVLHTYSKEKSKTMSAIVEVTAIIYKQIKENRSRLFVGYQNCRVYDVINVNPCGKCARYGHSTKKCQNEATCQKCAGNHLTALCTSTNFKCPNCDYNNNKYKTKYDVNHSAIDSELCEILKNKIKKFIETTDYPLQPTYQRYFGKVERINDQPRIIEKRARLTSSASVNSLPSPTPPVNKGSVSSILQAIQNTYK